MNNMTQTDLDQIELKLSNIDAEVQKLKSYQTRLSDEIAVQLAQNWKDGVKNSAARIKNSVEEISEGLESRIDMLSSQHDSLTNEIRNACKKLSEQGQKAAAEGGLQ